MWDEIVDSRERGLRLWFVVPIDPESGRHSVKRPPVDAEHLRGPCPVTARRLQHMCEVAALHLVERGQIFEECHGGLAPRLLQRQLEVVGTHHRSATEKHNPLNGVLELSHVAGPVIRIQKVQGAGGELDLWSLAHKFV